MAVEIQYNQEPVFVDRLITILRGIVGGLTYLDSTGMSKQWIENVYGLAKKDENSNEPKVYYKDKEYISVIPDDRAKSMCFFYMNGRATWEEGNVWTFPISLVVWLNERAIDKRNYQIDIELIQRLQQVIINRFKQLQGMEVYFRVDSKQIFDVFDPKVFLPNDMPYSCFRIAMRIRFDFSDYCLPDFQAQNNPNNC